jgi:hypothetical protein
MYIIKSIMAQVEAFRSFQYKRLKKFLLKNERFTDGILFALMSDYFIYLRQVCEGAFSVIYLVQPRVHRMLKISATITHTFKNIKGLLTEREVCTV